MPRSSPAEPRPILIAAVSGRALAASARRAGRLPLVADFFADADTQRIAAACAQLPGDIGKGFTLATLVPALEALTAKAPSPPIGLVYGGGFEDRTPLLAELASRFPLLGNDAETVRRVKNPEFFFGMLAKLGIPHPSTLITPPATAKGWLQKKEGGAGGSHIRPWTGRSGGRDRRTYYQERVPGEPVSVLFVANGREAAILGFSEQWALPKRGSRWRYGGAVQPASIPRELAETLTSQVRKLVPAFGLKGLGSADFLVDGSEARLIEVNPRPGATLDIFDTVALPLLHLHLQAVLDGIVPMGPLPPGEATAASIVYAEAPIQVAPGMEWPDWTSDQPKFGDRIDKDRPLCTVMARAGTGHEARRLVEERRKMILQVCADQNGGSR